MAYIPASGAMFCLVVHAASGTSVSVILILMGRSFRDNIFNLDFTGEVTRCETARFAIACDKVRQIPLSPSEATGKAQE